MRYSVITGITTINFKDVSCFRIYDKQAEYTSLACWLNKGDADAIVEDLNAGIKLFCV